MTFKDLMKKLDGYDRQTAIIKARMTGAHEALNVSLVEDIESPGSQSDVAWAPCSRPRHANGRRPRRW